MPGRVSAEHSGEHEMAAAAGSSAEGSLCCPLLSDDIKACQGCEGTDCEFPVFNVFHPELGLYSDISNSRAFSGSYTPLRLLFCYRIKATATQMNRSLVGLDIALRLLCALISHKKDEGNSISLSHRAVVRINIVLWC